MKITLGSWKKSAQILGLKRFFDFKSIPYKLNEDSIEFDYEYNKLDYLNFVDEYFKEVMLYNRIPDLIERNKKSEVNDLLKYSGVSITYNEQNGADVLAVLEKERYNIIETIYANKYREGGSGYAFFKGRFSKEGSKVNRLCNEYFDVGTKGFGMSYRGNKNSIFNDDSTWDNFIPFAFTTGRHKYFINSSYNTTTLVEANNVKSYKEILLTTKHIRPNIEVISFTPTGSFSRYLITQDYINRVQQLKDHTILDKSISINGVWINIADEVIGALSSGYNLDRLIGTLLANKQLSCIKQLLALNYTYYTSFDTEVWFSEGFSLRERALKSKKYKILDGVVHRLIHELNTDRYDDFITEYLKLCTNIEYKPKAWGILEKELKTNKNIGFILVYSLMYKESKENE